MVTFEGKLKLERKTDGFKYEMTFNGSRVTVDGNSVMISGESIEEVIKMIDLSEFKEIKVVPYKISRHD